DLGPISWLLGMKVTQNREAHCHTPKVFIPHFDSHHTISLSQQSYIKAILMKYNLADCKPATVPMDPRIKL
ncbi:hypothetical protein M404DRAFT_88739, partial [Pisolithus tinctorius Marx 270]